MPFPCPSDARGTTVQDLSVKVVNYSMNERPSGGQLLGYRTHENSYLGPAILVHFVNSHVETSDESPQSGNRFFVAAATTDICTSVP